MENLFKESSVSPRFVGCLIDILSTAPGGFGSIDRRPAPYTLLGALVLSLTSLASLAGNFSIDPAPGHPIIISVGPRSTASVFYIVKNLTQHPLSDYTLQGAPNTVIHNGTSPYCSNPVTLPAGESCELRLDITGKANSSFALCHGASCTTASTPLNVGLNSGDFPPSVAVGSYSTTKAQLPLLVEEINSIWIYPIITAPADLGSSAQFLTTSCDSTISTKYCIAAGYYDTSNNIQYPLLYLENPPPQTPPGTWANIVSSASPALPADYIGLGQFVSSACANNNGSSYCIASGSYSSSTEQFPMIATVASNSVKYTFDSISSGLPSDYDGNGIFNTASCINNICVVGGSYDTAPNQQSPLAEITSDAGNTWILAYYAYPGLPSDYAGAGSFSSSTCMPVSGAVSCVLVGSYGSTNPVTNQFPWIASSADVVNDAFKFVLSDENWPYTGSTDAAFSSISCSSNNCVAVGSYKLKGLVSPLMAQSTDGGSTWLYNQSFDSYPKANGLSFSAVSCSGSTCLVVGNLAVDATHRYGILSYSTNGGSDWSTIGRNEYPSVYTSVNCTEGNCMVSGSQLIKSTPTPYLLVSVDSGQSITAVIGYLTPQPPGLSDGSFYDNAFITTPFLPESLKMLYTGSNKRRSIIQVHGA